MNINVDEKMTEPIASTKEDDKLDEYAINFNEPWNEEEECCCAA